MNSGRERVERRLAAILAADVAGYSRLMGTDEEGTLAALQAIRRELCDPKIIEILGMEGGFDGVWLDNEHAGVTVAQIENATRAARGAGLETFVRLAGEREQHQDWVEGMFATHPPSQERVEANKKTAAKLGPGGEVGADRYQARIRPLLDIKPAYDSYDAAMAAAGKRNFADAKRLAGDAVACGIDGCLLIDLSVEEAEGYSAAMRDAGLVDEVRQSSDGAHHTLELIMRLEGGDDAVGRT